MSKKRKYVAILLIIIVSLGTISLVNLFRAERTLQINFQTINNSAGKGTAAQGNYVLLCENNGIEDFPFLMGGKLSLLSLPDGKKYLAARDAHFLGGMGEPAIQGDMVYWFGTWDGSDQGDFHALNLRDKKETFQTPEYLYNDYYAFSGHDIYYAKNGQVLKQDMKTGSRKVVMKRNCRFLAVEASTLYCYEKKTGTLVCRDLVTGREKIVKPDVNKRITILDLEAYQQEHVLIQTGKQGILDCDISDGTVKRIVENGDLTNGNNIGENTATQTMRVKEGMLYYCDMDSNIFEKNLSTGEIHRIFDWKKAESVFAAEIKDSNDLAFTISWCSDYIALQIGFLNPDNDAWKTGILAIDYEGNEVYRDR